jgi:hypothetical protein
MRVIPRLLGLWVCRSPSVPAALFHHAQLVGG